MVAHNGVANHLDREQLGQEGDARNDPLAPVLVILAGVSVLAAEKGAPNAAARTMVIAGELGIGFAGVRCCLNLQPLVPLFSPQMASRFSVLRR